VKPQFSILEITKELNSLDEYGYKASTFYVPTPYNMYRRLIMIKYAKIYLSIME